MQGAAESEELRGASEALAGCGLVAVQAFSTAEELSQFLSESAGPFRVRIGSEENGLSYTGAGITELAHLDQTVTFESATTVSALQAELAKHGQTVPLSDIASLIDLQTPFGELLAMNMPIPGQNVFGSYRDWVLGLTVVLANGEIVKCGSKAVKSVAGYDLHKLFIGARHTLGIVTSITLRTYPLASFEAAKLNLQKGSPATPTWIQKTRRTDFSEAVERAAGNLILADHDSCTLWASADKLKRWHNDWVIRDGKPVVDDPVQQDLMIKIKTKLDPKRKLNPGEFGFL